LGQDDEQAELMIHLHCDFESASRIDLKRAGASRYAQDPSTVVLCVAYAYNDGPVQKIILPTRGMMQDILSAKLYDDVLIHAWNANFETAILRHKFGLDLGPENFSCTMQRALYSGLPGKLEHAGPALRIPIVKDMAGHRLMLSMSKPRKDGTFWHQDLNEGRSKLDALAAYCEADVEAERAIAGHIPNLSSDERAVSVFDATTNRRGIRLDLPFVDQLITIAEAETQALNAECMVLTNAAVTSPGTQTDRILGWLRNEGCDLPDVSKETITETLETAEDAGLPNHVIQVLRIRQNVAKSSVHKLKAMKACVDADGRVRGTLQYYGARTGRWGGRLIQPQNFPRPEDYAPAAVSAVLKGIDNGGIRLFFDEPLAAVSSMLRSTIIPADGNQLFVADFDQIEARVLAWLAGQRDLLDVFDRGEDVYEYTAQKLGLGSRKAGKVAVLGLGYGMGPRHFVEFAENYDLVISFEEAQRMVTDWRQANPKITEFWRKLDDAVRYAISGNLVANFNRIYVRVSTAMNGDPLLTIKLPSGRQLFYRNIRLEPDPLRPGRDGIVYDGTDPITKRWTSIRSWGAKFAENVTQAVARDVMVEAGLRVAETPLGVLVLSVHDELVFETSKTTQTSFEALKLLIETRPAWAQDLPVKAKGAFMQRYGK
jgi:DNA polymerase bacteriophage-type